MLCGTYGLEEISGDLSLYGPDEGCNFEGPDGVPVSESINLVQEGDAIKFEQMVQIPSYSYGSSVNFKVNYSHSGNKIEVRETYFAEDGVTQDAEAGSSWISSPVPICSKYLSGRIDNLEKGTYILAFILDDENSGESRLLGEMEFEVN
jgi:hypothetical protein